MSKNLEKSTFPPDFPHKAYYEEAVFIRTELLEIGNMPEVDMKRVKLMGPVDDVEMNEILFNAEYPFTSSLDDDKHVHFDDNPPQEFFTFANDEYDRKSTSPQRKNIDYYNLWLQKQELDMLH